MNIHEIDTLDNTIHIQPFKQRPERHPNNNLGVTLIVNNQPETHTANVFHFGHNSIIATVEIDSKQLAIKINKHPKNSHKEIVKEARLLQFVSPHPNIQSLYGLGLADYKGTRYTALLTPYIQKAQSISHFFSSPKPDYLFPILEQTVEAVEHMKKTGVVHNDVGFRNILVDEKNNPIIIDCSIGYKMPTNKTHITTNKPLGTQGFASPEQCRGFIGFTNDSYALTAVWLGILTGKDETNFNGAVDNFYYWDNFVMLPEYESVLNKEYAKRVLKRALNPYTEQRTPTAREFYHEMLEARIQ